MREFLTTIKTVLTQVIEQGREQARKQQELDLWRASFFAAVNEHIPNEMEMLGMQDFWDTISIGPLWSAVPRYVTEFSFGEGRVFRRDADPREKTQPQSWDVDQMNDHLLTYSSANRLRYELVVREPRVA